MTHPVFSSDTDLAQALMGALLRRLPPVEGELLRRCATVQTFDRRLFEAVLVPDLGPPVPTFEQAARHRFVEALPGRAERYQVQSSFRTALFHTWWPERTPSGAIPEALRALSGRLVAYYAERKDNNERLFHLATYDQGAATVLFAELCAAVEAHFDLSAYHALILLMEERLALLQPPGVPETSDTFEALGQQLREARRRLDTRSLWAQDYYESTIYYEREQTKGLFDELIEGKGHWILHLFAPGGVGKTMYIRSVIAHHCMPADIPCARIDFDNISNIAYAAREPWRMLLHIADQLNRQIPDALAHLLREYDNLVAGVTGQPGAAPPLTSSMTPEELEDLSQDIITRFTTAVQSAIHDQPLVLIFDTLENLRHRQLDLAGAFDMLKELHARLPFLRVILAGRFDLAEKPAHSDNLPNSARLPGFVERFKGQERTIRLHGFKTTEARKYLEQRRLLKDDPRIDALIEKSREGEDDGLCNPFKLALLADSVESNPSLTVVQIAEYEAADLAYLIERVVERIEDQSLRWLLRYGVVPRWLTKDFVEQVMVRHMRAGMEGASTDDPSQDALPLPSDKQLAWQQREDLGQHIDVVAIWEALVGYASRYSWVKPAGNEVPAALIFNDNVRVPMRRLLLRRQRETYTRLQRDASTYFATLSETDPGRRAQWLAESAVHKFRSGDADAEDYWRGLLTAADDTTAKILGATVLSPPASDEDLEVSEWLRALTGYELACRILSRPGPLTSEDIVDVDKWLGLATELQNAGKPVVHSALLASQRAALAIHKRQFQEAETLSRDALAAPADQYNELELRLYLADALKAQDDPEFLQHYRQVWDDGMKAAGTLQLAVRAALPLGASYAAREQYAAAVEAYRYVVAKSAAPSDVGPALLGLIQVLQELGHERAAAMEGEHGCERLQMLRDSNDQRDPARYWEDRTRIEVALARRLPDAALEILTALNQGLGKDSAPEADPLAWPIAYADSLARIAAARLDAHTVFIQREDLARSYYGPQSAKGIKCFLDCAALSLDPLDDSEQAMRYVSYGRVAARGSVEEIIHKLLDIACLAKSGVYDVARARALELAARDDLPPLLGLRARVAMEQVVQTRAAENALVQLVVALESVEPASFRLRLLGGLRRCPTPSPPPPQALAEQLLAMLPSPEDGQDPALYALRLSEVHRVVGQYERAHRLLDNVDEASLSPLRLTLRRERYLAGDRLRWLPGEVGTDLRERSDRTWGASPTLCGAMALEHAVRVLDNLRDVARAKELLGEARLLLGGLNSRWNRRISAVQARIADAETHGAPESLADDGANTPIENSLPGTSRPGRASNGGDAASAALIELAVTSSGVEKWDVRLLDGLSRNQYSYSVRPPWPQETDAPIRLKKAINTFAQIYVENQGSLGRVLSGDLLGPLSMHTLGTFDVRLVLGERDLAWLPWELLLLDENSQPLTLHRCRYFYRRPAAARWAALPRPANASVLVVGAGEDVLSTEYRDQIRTGSTELANIYQEHEFKVTELSRPDREELANAVRHLQPQAIHIIANVFEQRDQLFLGFNAGPAMKGATDQLTPREIGSALLQSESPPLLILQIVAQAYPHELVRQLCLRNALAADLAAFERLPAILCTGLATGRTARRLNMRLVETLAASQSIGQVARAIWMEGAQVFAYESDREPQADSWLPLLGTALYTHDPEQIFR